MNKKMRRPVKVMFLITLVLVLLGIIAYFASNYVMSAQQKKLADEQAAVEQYNREQQEAYDIALAEFAAANQPGTANEAWPAHSNEGWDVVDLTNYPLENPGQVSLNRTDIMANGMLLVNQWHSRPEDFPEAGLVSVGSYTRGAMAVSDYSVRLFPVAIDALREAVDAAAAAGHKDYMVSEGYRSWEDQNSIFQKAMARYQDRYSGDALIERTKRDVNSPGTSEFNSGLGFTLRLYNKEDASIGKPAYTTTAAGQWMCENSWRYGIVFRFPLTDFPVKGTADKSYKTGVSAELNLYRYVGKGNAAVMNHLGLCMEEYIEYLMEHPHIAVFEDGVLKYEVTRQYVGEEGSVAIQTTNRARSYECSLDNMGYAIVVFNY